MDAPSKTRQNNSFALFHPFSPLTSTRTGFFDCCWVGSLDFNVLVEIKLGFPLDPQKVFNFLQGGRCNNQESWKEMAHVFLRHHARTSFNESLGGNQMVWALTRSPVRGCKRHCPKKSGPPRPAASLAPEDEGPRPGQAPVAETPRRKPHESGESGRRFMPGG